MAVRISTTGATKILNSKMEYSRSRLQKIISIDFQEEASLGDSDKSAGSETNETENDGEDDVFKDEMDEIESVMLTVTKLAKSEARKARKGKMFDLIRWGHMLLVKLMMMKRKMN